MSDKQQFSSNQSLLFNLFFCGYCVLILTDTVEVFSSAF